MKPLFRILFFILCAIPLASRIPYFIEVWESSPLEINEIFIYLGLPIIFAFNWFFCRKIEFNKSEIHRIKFFALLIFLLYILWFIFLYKINIISIIIGIGIFSLGFYIAFGKRVFMAQIPMFFAMFISAPSVSFWIDYYCDISNMYNISIFLIKVFTILLFVISWNLYAYRIKRYPNLESMLFLTLALFAFIFMNIRNKSPNTIGDPLLINDYELVKNNWISEEVPVLTSDEYIFSRSKSVRRRTFFNNEWNVDLLLVKVGDVHDIHPIGVCLKSAGYRVLSHKIIYPKIDEKVFQMKETRIKRLHSTNDDEFIVYSWFSSDKKSISDFTTFRMHANNGENWNHYRLQIKAHKEPLKNDEVLENYIRNFRIRNN